MTKVACVVAGMLMIAVIAGCGGSADRGAPGSTSTSRPSPSATTNLAAAPPSTVAAPPGATILQPSQPTSGPGGSALPNGDWRVSEGGSGADAWYVFEPIAPQPASAPVAVVMHGYYEYAGYNSLYELIRHTVRTGRIVIYPRWQTGVATPCAGPIDIEPCIASADNGIQGALAYLRADPRRVQPDLAHTSYFGHSFGGIITANLANRWQRAAPAEATGDLPRRPPRRRAHRNRRTGARRLHGGHPVLGPPRVPRRRRGCHRGGGQGGQQLQRPLARCSITSPSGTRRSSSPDPMPMANRRCRAGTVCAPRRPGHADAYDWNFCWKVFDALQSAAVGGTHGRSVLGDTARNRDLGAWSDGVPIAPLEIRHEGPIRP